MEAVTSFRRGLLMKIADDKPKAWPYLHQFDRLVQAEKFYLWLIRNGITGDLFVEYYEKKFQFSFKAFVEYIMARIKMERPLLASDLK